MRALRQLLTPVTYILITRRPKVVIDLILPLAAGAIFVVMREFVPSAWRVVAPDGLVGAMNAALPNLAGFYIAALAAVAGLNSPSLDQPLADKMHLPNEGKWTLSRRRFLCYLFGYLSFISFSLLFVGIFSPMIKSTLLKLLSGIALQISLNLAMWLYVSAIWALFFTTLLGLHYLVDRTQRPEPQLVTGGDNAGPKNADTRETPGVSPKQIKRISA